MQMYRSASWSLEIISSAASGCQSGADEAHLCQNHQDGLQQQRKLESVSEPEETSRDVRYQPVRVEKIEGE
jgi:hypothetical protein